MKKNNEHDKVNKKWLYFADEDYKIIIYLWNKEKKFYRSICFHAQQYVEKVLKGILEEKGDAIPRIHDINALVRRVEKLGIKVPLTENQILFLSSVYIDTRYPPDVGLLPDGEPQKKDTEIAVKAAKKIREWID